jgi:hypothetical protein
VTRPTQFLYQLVPRVSKEIMENKREYNNLCNSFAEFFDWVEAKVFFLFFAFKLHNDEIPSY